MEAKEVTIFKDVFANPEKFLTTREIMDKIEAWDAAL